MMYYAMEQADVTSFNTITILVESQLLRDMIVLRVWGIRKDCTDREMKQLHCSFHFFLKQPINSSFSTKSFPFLLTSSGAGLRRISLRNNGFPIFLKMAYASSNYRRSSMLLHPFCLQEQSSLQLLFPSSISLWRLQRNFSCWQKDSWKVLIREAAPYVVSKSPEAKTLCLPMIPLRSWSSWSILYISSKDVTRLGSTYLNTQPWRKSFMSLRITVPEAQNSYLIFRGA